MAHGPRGNKNVGRRDYSSIPKIYDFTSVTTDPTPKEGFYGKIYDLQDEGWEVLNFTDSGEYPRSKTICYLRKEKI